MARTFFVDLESASELHIKNFVENYIQNGDTIHYYYTNTTIKANVEKIKEYMVKVNVEGYYDFKYYVSETYINGMGKQKSKNHDFMYTVLLGNIIKMTRNTKDNKNLYIVANGANIRYICSYIQQEYDITIKQCSFEKGVVYNHNINSWLTLEEELLTPSNLIDTVHKLKPIREEGLRPRALTEYSYLKPAKEEGYSSRIKINDKK